MARTQHRRQGATLSAALALEPTPPAAPTPLRKELMIATRNLRGIKQSGKRKEIERYMSENDIDIQRIQETHSSGNTKERRKWYTWFFSGGPDGEICYHGVGIVLNNQHLKYVKYVNAVDATLMAMTPHRKVGIHIVTAYAPIAISRTQDKDELYTELIKFIKPNIRKEALLVGGDIDAKFREEDIDRNNGI